MIRRFMIYLPDGSKMQHSIISQYEGKPTTYDYVADLMTKYGAKEVVEFT